MARTIRNIDGKSKRVRIWKGLVKPHQIATKSLDVPRGLYEPGGKGDAWGQTTVRTLKLTRRRHERQKGKRELAELV